MRLNESVTHFQLVTSVKKSSENVNRISSSISEKAKKIEAQAK